MYIYCITNKINGKQYVGQTTKTLGYRWYRHNYAFSDNSKRTAINLALKKYGKENFTIIQIDTACHIDELNDKEVHWIKELNTMSPNGYNLKEGGGNKQLSEETKKKISESNKGKKRTDETKAKLRQSHLGIKMSDTAKKKLSETNKGKKSSLDANLAASWANSKLFVLNLNDMLYVVRNMRKFCQEHNLFTSTLSQLCTGKKTSYKGFSLVESCGKLKDLKLTTEKEIKTYIENKYSDQINYFI